MMAVLILTEDGWISYEEGFGSLNGEFCYGLHPLHCLTNQGQWQLRIDFTFSNGIKLCLPYNKFSVGSVIYAGSFINQVLG